MATRKNATPKATPATCRDNATGQLKCPKCGAPCVPLKGKAAGKGWGCSRNVWDFKTRTASDGKGGKACDGIIWNKSNFQKREAVPRAEKFPTINAPTSEQTHVRTLMGQTPAQRGGRCVGIDAGPGTGKTTTVSWGLEATFRRLGSLARFPVCAFNVNARDVLLSKLPPEVQDVFTLNGWHGQAQGYRYAQYAAGKLRKLMKEATDHLTKEDKPEKPGVVGKLIERMRDVCLYNSDTGALAWWAQATAETCARFPSFGKKLEQSEEAHELCRDYAPTLTVQALANRSTIDIQEQITRPVSEACDRTGWRMRFDCVGKPASEWTADDITHFAALIRAIRLPSVVGMVVDEAQDLSLCQIAVILAQTWKTGELIFIGDDCHGMPGDDDYKAGQGIYGWRGAFAGSFNLISRLWHELTGENVVRAALTITFRHGPETCEAYRELNRVIRSGRPEGYSKVYTVNPSQAFTAWLDTPEGETALWITRTNAPLAGMLRDTIKAQAECCIRGNDGFPGQIDGVLYEAAGFPDDGGEYIVPLPQALAKLAELQAQDDEGTPDPNSLYAFVAELGELVRDEPAVLTKAGLAPVATVGNLARFIKFYATKDARRVLTTVYRCKGDEADRAIVGDVEKFNTSWGDVREDAACRHVAASRGKRLTLFVGKLAGVNAPAMPDTDDDENGDE